ncbi:hypothetical protein [Succinatimonas hippei]|uniref:hypothetical protein n=1 Tax=Succinatimonas hippei TaxID=626938 RepID=UPI0023F926AA|nr:hypothetical protein [Succinatimonas hippei]
MFTGTINIVASWQQTRLSNNVSVINHQTITVNDGGFCSGLYDDVTREYDLSQYYRDWTKIKRVGYQTRNKTSGSWGQTVWVNVSSQFVTLTAKPIFQDGDSPSRWGGCTRLYQIEISY